MILKFMIDRQGSGLNRTYAHELTMTDVEFVPGVDDLVSLRPRGEDVRMKRMVYKRVFEFSEEGETVVTVYADHPSALLRRRRQQRIEEVSKMDLWRAPSEVMSR